MGGPAGANGFGVGAPGAGVVPPASVSALEKSSEQQFDAIQSLMQQLTKMQPSPTPDQIKVRNCV